jgi:hypothetical protein
MLSASPAGALPFVAEPKLLLGRGVQKLKGAGIGRKFLRPKFAPFTLQPPLDGS